ncbi:MAG: dynamin family protein [Rhizomicrobium sp.]
MPRVVQEAGTAGARVAGLIAQVRALIQPPPEAAIPTLGRLATLADRLSSGRLQLAVVGQFKRGKSTLLNALLGAHVLPSAVTPLTALPTYVKYGPSLRLSTVDLHGTREMLQARDAAELRQFLDARVTEDGNPKNCRELVRVEIEFPAPLLATGIVLIDTPGVGSTYRHNTATAEATLPECDAALFVVSPDPPITEIEIAYLGRLRSATSTITVVLNKVDLVDTDDRKRSEDFLKRAIVEAWGLQAIQFFSVSARAALNARLHGNTTEFKKTGLPNLEENLAQFAETQRLATLEIEAARKAAALVRELEFIIELQIGAYRIPISDLSSRLEQFCTAETEFARERDSRHDLLKGDRQRLLSELDQRAALLCTSGQDDLWREITRQAKDENWSEDIGERIAQFVPRLFQDQFEAFQVHFRQRIDELFGRHQRHADDLIASVRRAAANLLDVPHPPPDASTVFVIKRTPYWVTTPRESLGAAPSSFFFRFMPRKIRARWLRHQIAIQANGIMVRNVENLRWALRQNLEETFVKFQADLDERLLLTQRATTQAIEEALKRRAALQSEGEEELTRLTEAASQLRALAAELDVSLLDSTRLYNG